MRLLLPASLSLLLLASQAARAQTADDFFNSGAQFYISNNIANAKQAVDGGLKLYPDDVKLKKLEELLKQQQQQQQQQNSQSSKNQNQPQQSQSPSRPDQPQQQQQTPNPSGQPNDQQQQEKQRQAQSAGKQSEEKKEGDTSQTQASAAREMSPEEARRLLDAQKGDEQFLQLKPKTPPESQNKPIKDW